MAASPLISSAALSQLLGTTRGLVLLDVRWRLGFDDARGEYAGGHIPGAIYVDLETDLSGPHDEQAGRHPLPSPEAVEQAAARWGVRPDSLVVVYDDNNGMSAARAWWLLRWIGHERVHVLDGGLSAWRAAGGPLTAAETPEPSATPAVPRDRGSMPTVDADDIGEGRVEILLDAAIDRAIPGRVRAGRSRRRAHSWRHQRADHGQPRSGWLLPECGRTAQPVRTTRRLNGSTSGRVLRERRDGRPRDPRAGSRRDSRRPLRAVLVGLDCGSEASSGDRRRVRALRSPCQLRACQYARRRDIVEPARRCSPHVA